MKTFKMLMITSLLFVFTIGTFAQRKTVTTLSADTVIGTGATYSDSLPTKLADHINLQIVATQIGGTSEGAGYLLGSVDGTSWANITERDGLVSFFQNDTLTITNGVIWNIAIKYNPWKYIKLKYTGGDSDTTLMTTKYTIAN